MASLRSLSNDACLEGLSQVLASSTFARSARLSSFLRFVCTSTLEGRQADLCEQHIGVRVFGRPEHYNPAEDTIVRTTARLLRQRLTQYYESEGRQDEVRIAIPRGAYVPVFVPFSPGAPDAAAPATASDAAAPLTPVPVPAPVSMPAQREPAPAEEPKQDPALPLSQPQIPQPRIPAPEAPPLRAAPPAPSEAQSMPSMPAPHDAATAGLAASAAAPASPPARRYLALLAAALAGAAIAALLLLLPRITPASASDKFWASLLSAERDTLLVMADSGLVMYQSETRNQVGLDDYMTKRVPEPRSEAEAKSANHFKGGRRYTAMSSVFLATELTKLAKEAPQRLHMRFARDLLLGDLKRSNIIITGVAQSNPWWDLYRKQLNFHIDWDPVSDNFIILNDRPQPGEQARHTWSKDDPQKHGFATIAYTRGLSSEVRALLVGGTTSAGTEAAAEFLLNPARMTPILQQATEPDGSLGEFEILLQCVLQLNGNTDTRILGVRFKRT